MTIDGHTQIIGIFGWPLTYTRSPKFQNAGLSALGSNAVYLPFPVEPEHFPALWRGLSKLPHFLGANVTNPHKQVALKLADALTPEARAIGAVNTLFRRGKRWVGGNTDAAGFLKALPQSPRGRRVLVLGAGGTARALVYALKQGGAAHITVACRRPAQGRALLAFLKLGPKRAQCRALDSSWEDLLENAEFIVNTVPDRPFTAGLGRALKHAGRLRLAMDVSYADSKNPFLAAARRRHVRTATGLGMLLQQGCLALQAWTGKKAPERLMARALGH